MISMLFMSLYFIIDDIFIGKILGVKALAAAGLIIPFIMISFSLIDIIAVGSSVQISLHLGQKDYKKASGIFSFSLIFIVMVSMLFFVLGILSLEWLCLYFIDDIELANLCIEYARIYILFYPFVALYFAIDDYLRIAKKPIYSMILNLIVAIINLVLDYLFLAVTLQCRTCYLYRYERWRFAWISTICFAKFKPKNKQNLYKFKFDKKYHIKWQFWIFGFYIFVCFYDSCKRYFARNFHRKQRCYFICFDERGILCFVVYYGNVWRNFAAI
ncbi:hypothetical protein CDQ71_01570 [Campylobacter hyointestinalis subsp. hyointestinalis]|uniref:MATE family efflux transporter n=1 Tax=Campylobacter hyointestinalis TaxID=198 RepID=UPI000CE411CB|nr:MATE family efflux transporter [Campylobacter hyointestinalis]PPB59014.1 hypothetical protein CDQ71_01570 [Campylobacter hyointestinalis subsp. hyointestinalis]